MRPLDGGDNGFVVAWAAQNGPPMTEEATAGHGAPLHPSAHLLTPVLPHKARSKREKCPCDLPNEKVR